MPPFGGFPGTSHWEKTPGQTLNLLYPLLPGKDLSAPLPPTPRWSWRLSTDDFFCSVFIDAQL